VNRKKKELVIHAFLNAQARHKLKTGRVMAIKGFVQLWLSNPCIHFALDALSR
jgi:hypothetical protein